jgi:hypothetical protein
VTASEYLGQVEVLNVRIDQKRKELERIQNEAYGVKGMRYDTDRVQTSPVDHMPDMVIRCIELESEIQKDIERNIEFRHRIIYQIQGLPDIRHVQVLYSKYVELKDNSDIASEMSYAEDYVRKLIGIALGEFERRYRRSFRRVVTFTAPERSKNWSGRKRK